MTAIGCVRHLHAAAVALAATVTVLATPSSAKVFTETLHVKIDHMTHTAYVYDAEFNRLRDSPNDPWTSIVEFPDQRRWLLGFNADVVRRHPDGVVEVVSQRPAYHEMVHHFVFTYESPHRPVVDACSNKPIAAGSELSDFSMPAGYAYSMQGGVLRAISQLSRHWANPFDVPHEEDVYLRFILLFDDAGVYRDTHVTWVGFSGVASGIRCDEEFAVPPGPSELEGPAVAAPEKMRIVAALPHFHDHAEYIELRSNGKKVRRFKPAYVRVRVGHDDVGEGPTPVHAHPNGGHLPAQGLYAWTPGKWGRVIEKGDPLSVLARFNNPHRRSIDNMAIAVVFWEPVGPSTEPPGLIEDTGEDSVEE